MPIYRLLRAAWAATFFAVLAGMSYFAFAPISSSHTVDRWSAIAVALAGFVVGWGVESKIETRLTRARRDAVRQEVISLEPVSD